MVQAIAAGALLLSAKFAMQYLDPYREQREQVKGPVAVVDRLTDTGKHKLTPLGAAQQGTQLHS